MVQLMVARDALTPGELLELRRLLWSNISCQLDVSQLAFVLPISVPFVNWVNIQLLQHIWLQQQGVAWILKVLWASACSHGLARSCHLLLLLDLMD